MEWPDIRAMQIKSHHSLRGRDGRVAYNEPHLCDVPDCPGPKLVAKLEAAEDLAHWVRSQHCYCEPAATTPGAVLGSKCSRCQALAAWESAHRAE